MLCALTKFGTADLGGRLLPCNSRKHVVLQHWVFSKLHIHPLWFFPHIRIRGIDFKNPQGELRGGRCYGTNRSTTGFSSLPSWLLPSQSARKLTPVSLGTKGFKNVPQTKNLELMTYVPPGICSWVAIAANPLTSGEDDNTGVGGLGRCNTILQALVPINIYWATAKC